MRVSKPHGSPEGNPDLRSFYHSVRDAEFEVKARLAAGVSVAQARAELETIGRRLALDYPSTENDHVFTLRTESQQRLKQDLGAIGCQVLKPILDIASSSDGQV